MSSIFHYCKLSTAIEKILPQMQLKLSPLNKTNDPRENKAFVFAALRRKEDIHKDIDVLNSGISKLLQENCKVLCFSTSHGEIKGYELSNMWAFYAQNHKGICIEIDEDKFIKDNEINVELFKKVIYHVFDKKSLINPIVFDHILNESKPTYLDIFKKQNADYLYFTKDKVWEHESEKRLIYFSKSKIREFCRITDSLKKIYLGEDFNEVYLPAIQKLCPDTNIYKLKYESGRLIPTLIKN